MTKSSDRFKTCGVVLGVILGNERTRRNLQAAGFVGPPQKTHTHCRCRGRVEWIPPRDGERFGHWLRDECPGDRVQKVDRFGTPLLHQDYDDDP